MLRDELWGPLLENIIVQEDSQMTTLYESMVIPVMDYCSALWGFKEHSKCDVVQNRAMQRFLGVGKFAPLSTLSGDMCWFCVFSSHLAHYSLQNDNICNI